MKAFNIALVAFVVGALLAAGFVSSNTSLSSQAGDSPSEMPAREAERESQDAATIDDLLFAAAQRAIVEAAPLPAGETRVYGEVRLPNGAGLEGVEIRVTTNAWREHPPINASYKARDAAAERVMQRARKDMLDAADDEVAVYTTHTDAIGRFVLDNMNGDFESISATLDGYGILHYGERFDTSNDALWIAFDAYKLYQQPVRVETEDGSPFPEGTSFHVTADYQEDAWGLTHFNHVEHFNSHVPEAQRSWNLTDAQTSIATMPARSKLKAYWIINGIYSDSMSAAVEIITPDKREELVITLPPVIAAKVSLQLPQGLESLSKVLELGVYGEEFRPRVGEEARRSKQILREYFYRDWDWKPGLKSDASLQPTGFALPKTGNYMIALIHPDSRIVMATKEISATAPYSEHTFEWSMNPEHFLRVQGSVDGSEPLMDIKSLSLRTRGDAATSPGLAITPDFVSDDGVYWCLIQKEMRTHLDEGEYAVSANSERYGASSAIPLAPNTEVKLLQFNDVFMATILLQGLDEIDSSELECLLECEKLFYSEDRYVDLDQSYLRPYTLGFPNLKPGRYSFNVSVVDRRDIMGGRADSDVFDLGTLVFDFDQQDQVLHFNIPEFHFLSVAVPVGHADIAHGVLTGMGANQTQVERDGVWNRRMDFGYDGVPAGSYLLELHYNGGTKSAQHITIDGDLDLISTDEQINAAFIYTDGLKDPPADFLFKQGDQLIGVDGKRFADEKQMIAALDAQTSPASRTLMVVRDGKQIELTYADQTQLMDYLH